MSQVGLGLRLVALSMMPVAASTGSASLIPATSCQRCCGRSERGKHLRRPPLSFLNCRDAEVNVPVFGSRLFSIMLSPKLNIVPELVLEKPAPFSAIKLVEMPTFALDTDRPTLTLLLIVEFLISTLASPVAVTVIPALPLLSAISRQWRCLRTRH